MEGCRYASEMMKFERIFMKISNIRQVKQNSLQKDLAPIMLASNIISN